MLGSRIEGSEWIMAATIVIVIAIIMCHLILFWTGSQGLLQAQFLFQRFLLPPIHLICILLGNLARQIFSPSPSLGTSIPYLSLNCPFFSICSANVRCCSSVAKLCLTFCDPRDCTAHQAALVSTISQNLLKLMSMMPSNHLILCHPLLLLPSIFPSITVFSNESVLQIRWPNYWSFSFSISPSNEYSRLISFRIDWFDLLAVQGILKSLLQHHNSKASIFQPSAFFMVQLSHLYITTGKTIALTAVSLLEEAAGRRQASLSCSWDNSYFVILVLCPTFLYLHTLQARNSISGWELKILLLPNPSQGWGPPLLEFF